ncbi:YdcF family protein [Hyphomicrobium sp.]|uniref:YdcF family protein n=1 Tax=Hyphomicrobium sp. TaxID=82 RepID=UPI0025BEDDCB|nr:YdcF family protein [Hyphomicrobium sp.]MCC7253599.1 YdcF family protein [Hyphomicrobium sp.]
MGLRRIIVGLLGCALALVAFGFVLFANSVMRDPEVQNVQADGIVVLTGGQTRISEAARLLEDKRGERLLISGVNQKIGRPSLLKISGLDEKTFNCCVDLGYAALNTIGNADETRRWAEALGYDRLIVVTASYHMPRSLAELARAMPNIELVPHPVAPDVLRRKVWWLDSTATRLLASEYIKFLPAAVRLAIARGMAPWQATSLTASSTIPRKS